jgi:hypothetical protein
VQHEIAWRDGATGEGEADRSVTGTARFPSAFQVSVKTRLAAQEQPRDLRLIGVDPLDSGAGLA